MVMQSAIALGLIGFAIGSSTSSHSSQKQARFMAAAQLPRAQKHQSFVQAAQGGSKMMMRICNAYPYATELDVYQGNAKLMDGPIPYKSCEDVEQLLGRGQRITAREGERVKGSFKVTGSKVESPAMLLLVMRPGGESHPNRLTFTSHAFSQQNNAQVAVLDVFGGQGAHRPLQIRDRTNGRAASSENLAYNSVLNLLDGDYDCLLGGLGGSQQSPVKLHVRENENYVVLRVGTQDGKPHSGRGEELLVFPQLESKSAAVQHSGFISAILTVMLSAWVFN